MRRIARTSAVFVAAIACLSFSAAAASAASAATVQPSSHAVNASSNVAPEAAAHEKAAATAQADVPNASVLCNGDLCVQDFVGNTTQTVHAWAYTYSFKGHFELEYGCSTAGCNIANSPNKTWPAGGTHWSFTYTSAIISQCVWAWKGPSSTGTYTNIGEVCFYS